MSTPLNAVEFTWIFSLSRAGTDEDIAEFSIWCYDNDYAPDEPQLLLLAQGAFNAWNDHVTPGRWTDNVFLSYVKARNFLANGHTLMEQTYVPTTAWVGTGSHPSLPWETSLALSLYTYPRGSFVPNGRRRRGRIYLPPMRAGILESSNSGYYSDSDLPTLLGELKDFVGAVGEDDLGVPHTEPCVFSRVDSLCRPITQLSIDAKFDSQRRRQNRETAGYLVTPYARD